MVPIKVRPGDLRNFLEHEYPGLRKDSEWAITSNQTTRYNCFAWAAHDELNNWEPEGDYWPEGCLRELTIPAFIEAYGSLGFSSVTTRRSPKRVERIAIFTVNGVPQHAARQLSSGLWTSKLGHGFDISHKLKSICCDDYGEVAVILERDRVRAD